MHRSSLLLQKLLSFLLQSFWRSFAQPCSTCYSWKSKYTKGVATAHTQVYYCVLSDMSFPNLSQINVLPISHALSRIDPIYFIQQALLYHTRDGSKPYLCPYDTEKAFDFPILLTTLGWMGNAGDYSRYDHPACCVKLSKWLVRVVYAVKRSTLQVILRKHSMKLSTLQIDLSAKLSVKVNIAKAKTTFLGGRQVHSRDHWTHFLLWVSLRLVSSLCCSMVVKLGF